MGPTAGRGSSGHLRQLHVVGYDPAQGGLVLAARPGAGTGEFVVAVDDTLLRHVVLARPGQSWPGRVDPRSHRPLRSGLSPREIQARLRSGRSLEEVADEAGVGVDWIERFAAPIFAEQAAAVERAGHAVLQVPRRGPSDRTLLASVLLNLAERGVAMAADEVRSAWSARHLADTDWLVSFRFPSRGRAVVAEWVYDMASGSLTTHNRMGGDLGFVTAPTASPADENTPKETERPPRHKGRRQGKGAPLPSAVSESPEPGSLPDALSPEPGSPADALSPEPGSPPDALQLSLEGPELPLPTAAPYKRPRTVAAPVQTPGATTAVALHGGARQPVRGAPSVPRSADSTSPGGRGGGGSARSESAGGPGETSDPAQAG